MLLTNCRQENQTEIQTGCDRWFVQFVVIKAQDAYQVFFCHKYCLREHNSFTDPILIVVYRQ